MWRKLYKSVTRNLAFIESVDFGQYYHMSGLIQWLKNTSCFKYFNGNGKSEREEVIQIIELLI